MPIIFNNNLKIGLFDFINDSIGWGIEDGIFITKDGGYSWIKQYEFTEDPTVIESIHIVDDSVVYATGWEFEQRLDPLKDRKNGILLKSKNGGGKFRAFRTPIPGDSGQRLHPPFHYLLI